jgi:hypothetical protein
MVFQQAPEWCDKTRPGRKSQPSSGLDLVLYSPPGRDGYLVLSAEQVRAVADPNSFEGRLLRPYIAYLRLPYLSQN